ncbi:uncharacterized protein [Lepeophtheirus salmonis]|uniref:uncharacterized protein n=1 Tax=Lepeophtheirus salmonis TaxID=72036 RepID=UPI003AF3402C
MLERNETDEAIERLSIPECIKSWYKNVLSIRTMTAKLKGEKVCVHQTRGSPQGGILSPFVWNMIMDSLLNKFKKGAIKVFGYADDILLLISGEHHHNLVNAMHRAINTVIEKKMVLPTEHLKNNASKCSRIWNMAKAIKGQKWGITSDKVIWLYEARIRPVVPYGCLVWEHAITIKKCARKILNTIQRKALLGMTHTFQSPATAVMEAV